MFIVVKAQQYSLYGALIDQAYRLRKRVFHDRLGWSVAIDGDYERDKYDALCPDYLMWCDGQANHLYGTLRLMPTTGPTLLFDVFRSTFAGTDLTASGICEGTRMCIDENALARDHPDINRSRAFGLLLLALCECGLANDIQTFVSNYEPPMARVYHRSGLAIRELGRADGFGKRAVCCGRFDVSDEVRVRMQQALGVKTPVYSGWPAMLSGSC